MGPEVGVPNLAGTATINLVNKVYGKLFDDKNGNGVYDTGDSVVSSQDVELMDSDGSSVGAGETDASGDYSIEISTADSSSDSGYYVQFPQASDLDFSGFTSLGNPPVTQTSAPAALTNVKNSVDPSAGNGRSVSFVLSLGNSGGYLNTSASAGYVAATQLTISDVMTGDADPNLRIPYLVMLVGPSASSFPVGTVLQCSDDTSAGVCGSDNTITVTLDGGDVYVYLSSGQSVTFTNLPVGTHVAIQEGTSTAVLPSGCTEPLLPAGYVTTWQDSLSGMEPTLCIDGIPCGPGASPTDAQLLLTSAHRRIEFTNAYAIPPLTGLSFGPSAPYDAMVVGYTTVLVFGGGVGVLTFIRRKRYARDVSVLLAEWKY
jgi:hypothetical protein